MFVFAGQAEELALGLSPLGKRWGERWGITKNRR
ncbi:hypothetical protein SBC1_57240 (plasmid) [Caballeronia sp. SBC1]|nr:hypothetical protein SBC2_56850 [Caballeronia sp. SBC2]QIN65679.1 hypothetical protein SBC1_57240 [Caballeronia sp. SBC1]